MTQDYAEIAQGQSNLAPEDDGGSTPTFPLHTLRVRDAQRKEAASFIEKHHYCRSTFGVTNGPCFIVSSGGVTVGAAMFGLPGGAGVKEKYSSKEQDLLELRRFVLLDEVPRNGESRCLGVMLRSLKRRGIHVVLSYADPTHGHWGTIYAACGFRYRGTTAKRKHVLWKGKKYPDRNIHQTNFPYHKELRAALVSGEAQRLSVPGKHIWVKVL